MHIEMLPNGMTLVLVPMPTNQVCVTFAVRGGHWNNPTKKTELYHILEHVLTHATQTHPSWEQFVRHTDTFTEDIDAETKATCIRISCTSLRRYAAKIVEFFANIICNPLFSDETIFTEMERIDEERLESEPVLSDTVECEIDNLMFKHVYKEAVGGQLSKISWKPTASELRKSYKRYFVGRRSILVIAGSFSSTHLRECVISAFAELPPGIYSRIRRIPWKKVQRKIVLLPYYENVVRYQLGFPTFGFEHPDRVALGVIRNHFVERSSSRLSVQLDGMANGYTVRNYFMLWQTFGNFSIFNSLKPHKFLEHLKTIAHEIRVLRENRILKDDLRYAKRSMRRIARIRFADPKHAASFYALQWINLGRIVSMNDYFRSLHSVTQDDIQRVAQTIFMPKRLILVAACNPRKFSARSLSHAIRFT
jgi:predicted Zn-dependent peptidase